MKKDQESVNFIFAKGCKPKRKNPANNVKTLAVKELDLLGMTTG